MPVRHCIVHFIDKKPDGSPAVLHARDKELPPSQVVEDMLADLNDSYNAKAGKAWGFFQPESGAYPFSGWLASFLDGKQDFSAFSRIAAEADRGVESCYWWPRRLHPISAGTYRIPADRPPTS